MSPDQAKTAIRVANVPQESPEVDGTMGPQSAGHPRGPTGDGTGNRAKMGTPAGHAESGARAGNLFRRQILATFGHRCFFPLGFSC
jgi:hypothetical protein